MIIYIEEKFIQISVRKHEGRGTLGDLGVDGILKWILKKQNGKAWIGFIWLRFRKTGGLLYTRY